MDIAIFYGGLIGAAPALVFWVAILILAIIMLRRGGRRTEQFLIVACSLKIAATVLGIFSVAISLWRFEAGDPLDTMSLTTKGYRAFVSLVDAAGTLGFLYAFWTRFRQGRAAPAKLSVLEANYDADPTS
ncbi:MAG TPA: hypothetical protein VMW13_01075 [Dehalococcoidales bacterium]|nr:hypothetical protein [Dehalococcoidales bacterium]